MQRRNRRLELVRPRHAKGERAVEGRSALGDLVRIPEAVVLVLEQHEPAVPGDPRLAACVLKQGQRMEAVYLRLVRHQCREQRCEPDRFRAELAPYRGAVAGVEDEVDRREHRPQPFGEKMLGRHTQRDARNADLPLRAHESLSECRLRHQERTRDLRRRQAADEAERQCHLRVGGQRRVAAGEDQLEAPVGNDVLLVRLERLRACEQLRLPRERLLAPDSVDCPVACRGDDPRAGVRRCPLDRPVLCSPDERVLHRVLGEIEVAEDAAEDRDATRTFVAVGAGEVVYVPDSE